jgi:hypothetical protein
MCTVMTIWLSALCSALAQDPPPQILRFVEGIDGAETPMSSSDVAAELNDPWGAMVLRKGVFPANLDEVLAAIDQLNQGGDGLPRQFSFFVSETGLIPVDNASTNLRREFRSVISRTNAGNSSIVFISVPAGDREGLIELMSWDAAKRAFNFYRRPQKKEWHWRGDTRTAFRPATLGKGCFRCHVHGAPIMKELRLPWNNWHSQSASIPPEAIPSQELRNSALFKEPPAGTKQKAELLERIVRSWVNTTIAARVTELMGGTTLAGAPDLVRPLFETTSANLASSSRTSDGNTPINLPTNFFLNADVLGDVLRLNISGSAPEVKRDIYRTALAKFDFHLGDGSVCDATHFCRKGDTHFAFFVPVPSLGDVVTIQQLIARNVITEHFAISVLMVDYPNPVYSASRRRLLQYVPQAAAVKNGKTDLAQVTAAAIVHAAATQPADSPEKRFAAYWALAPDQLRNKAEKELKKYRDAVKSKLLAQAGFDDYMRLAQSRRDRFAESPLNEFELLLPKTNIPKAELHMNVNGTVGP